MPSRSETPNRNEAFGRLLSGAINSIATYEGRTAPIIEEELGQLIGIAGKTIQRYKAGHLPPEDRTVEILATAAIQRGYLGREWLQRFLHAARYPFADKLLDRLCPIGPARLRPPRVYENLPAPTYSQFVMRQLAFDEVIDGLQQRSAVVLIVGLGGNGKTSLARELAARCLKDNGDAPRFDAVVWISDKDRAGTTNLSVVLDEIARTLDYPGFTQFEHDEKRREVENLLRRQRVLIVVDNFETISDGALLAWLLRLPEPSKAIVTSREYGRAFRRNCWPVELRGMRADEAKEFIGQRLRVLRIEKLVSDQAQLEPLVVATGGNPKAIEIALGLIKHEHRPLQQVVDDLYAARGDLFDDLFTRAWSLLDEAARRVLLVMTFFPDSASSEALSATADVHGFDFDHAIERLMDLALLDVQHADLNSTPRYTLHPLARAFAVARLREQPELEHSTRSCWREYLLNFTDRHHRGTLPKERCWNYFTTNRSTASLDAEWSNLQSVLEWVDQERDLEMLIELTMRLIHYMDRRLLYSYRIYYVSRAIEAAQHLGKKWDEAILRIDALGWILIEENLLDDAEMEIRLGMNRVSELESDIIDNKDLIALAYASLARIYVFRKEIRSAEEYINIALSLECHGVIRYRVVRAAGEIALAKGDSIAAIALFKDAISIAEENEGRGSIASSRLGFAYLSHGELVQAKNLFHEIIQRSSRDFVMLPVVRAKFGLACVAKEENNSDEAYRLAHEALDALSQLRVRHWLLKDIKQFLAHLEQHEASILDSGEATE